ncbi:glycoside hydrolase [Babesia caballi]|uniref:Glycoside hydrolase n=1 Tax=Babesia caballi TaxID=5871 RepID=A0AAV4LSD0_BABCB|nr:glycoside hydrolase [Babesia caballi]
MRGQHSAHDSTLGVGLHELPLAVGLRVALHYHEQTGAVVALDDDVLVDEGLLGQRVGQAAAVVGVELAQERHAVQQLVVLLALVDDGGADNVVEGGAVEAPELHVSEGHDGAGPGSVVPGESENTSWVDHLHQRKLPEASTLANFTELLHPAVDGLNAVKKPAFYTHRFLGELGSTVLHQVKLVAVVTLLDDDGAGAAAHERGEEGANLTSFDSNAPTNTSTSLGSTEENRKHFSTEFLMRSACSGVFGWTCSGFSAA